MKKVLTIAGSDPTGGAGIQADIKTMSAHGVYAMSVIVSVVAENTMRVISIEDISLKVIRDQIDAVYEDIGTDAVKIGMLSNSEIMVAVAQKLREYSPLNIVLDPVMYAKGGNALMAENSIETLIKELLPLCDLITPNIPEAEKITNMKIHSIEDMKRASEKILNYGCKSVLLKGGHYIGEAIDILYDGKDFVTYETKRIKTKNTHGTGCTLSSSIASNLALGFSLKEAISLSKEYITKAIEKDINIGKGHGPVNHFYNFFKEEKIYENIK
ncbi:bifunctional hydroxymethylpyrimidine kinase/phosphomethylpyrimidine kinase [Anaerosphaera multitolerans]|uniref:Hydroxymethylpyrimidine/phosphomethylpyrimidine kinase n=1 Tax=Anaerosphaera multitolerans TaxID=2487351 RepID=A0A437S4U1_9FIRM|nr:bifunctional hydroxymethylpyrimidine kinase/phosphomethylpyrimidine kinase [Anaerosphaera multitolerans]RVU53986.1 bifunctional hydroxymethylpyrimidine kinase/phosphomethylpyrimidine kinase [Anaerosphaera multitolerans]